MKGDTVFNTSGNYGTKGFFAPGNLPPARSYAGQWVDNIGDFWLFAGGRLNLNESRNDLWKYSPSLNQWMWVGGDSSINTPGSKGTQGVSASTNWPSNRTAGFLTWIDAVGNFWLFGGNSMSGGWSMLNDLWKYDLSTGWWTWMKGTPNASSVGSYGVKGVSSAFNEPPARDETSCAWTDNNGDLWLFGGRIYPTAGDGNDLWRYSVATNQWTWMSGSNAVNDYGHYGTKGVPSPSNVPSARQVYTNWKDSQGNLWLFGGYGPNGLNNDLWKYDVGSNQWTWVWGDSLATYGTVHNSKCISSAQNSVGERRYCNSEWTDDCDNLWLFGGWTQFGPRNDLWRYSIQNNEWTWISGDSLPQANAVYNTQGVPSASNNPGARYRSSAWKNKDGLWFFGGEDWNAGFNGGINDLWKFMPDTVIAAYTTSITSGCAPILINFSDSSLQGCNEIRSYAWSFDDSGSMLNDTSSVANPNHLFATSGVYNVSLSVEGCFGIKSTAVKSVNLLSNSINVSADVTIDYGSSTTLSVSSVGATTCSWFPSESLDCDTCFSTVASPTVTTTYFVSTYNANGCSAIDTVTVFVEYVCGEVFVPNAFSPNADNQNDKLCIYEKCIKNVEFVIYNRWGEKVFETSNPKDCWDGTYKNELQDTGVFMYTLVADFVNGKNVKKYGNISLVR